MSQSPILLLTAVLGVAASASAASDQIAARKDVKAALESVEAGEPDTIERQVRLCEVPAPPFREELRAKAFRKELQRIGMKKVRIDGAGNVLGEIAGRSAGPVVVLSAHLDTVFPAGTDVTVVREGKLLKGPGIVDDCRGLAVIVTVAQTILSQGLPLAGTLVIAATVGEEGEGNLRGVRHLFEAELADRVDAFITVDGAGDDVTNVGVGSERYRVTYRGPGGHSFWAFGLPNPIHALGRAIAKIAELRVSADPKVTFNVGKIEGGTSVNSIPFSAAMSVDMRSEDQAALAGLVSRFRQALEAALAEENERWDHPEKLSLEVETIGIRPSGGFPPDAPIVAAAQSTAKLLGLDPQLVAGSTDANLPMSLGIPAISIDGGGKGSGAHSPAQEVFDTTDSHLGTQWALLLSLALTGLE